MKIFEISNLKFAIPSAAFAPLRARWHRLQSVRLPPLREIERLANGFTA
jgi:hypothetical protein